MDNKRFFLIFGIFLILISVIGAYAADYKPEYGDLNYLLDETNESDLTGCCSIACQLDGNNSIFGFRRDARYNADIHIEEIEWHGKHAIKQYKTEGKYFCQVIITSDGWMIGYGGLDDGPDNQEIEDITGDMVSNNTIDNASLKKIQDIKRPYGRGHVLIKAPDGHYGVAMATTHFTGKLNPGQYISVPNKYSYVRNGTFDLNSSDKDKIVHKLEITDAYGLVRRDITTYSFEQVDNGTFKGNVTNITLSNDDGSTFGMSTGGSADNVIFNNTTIKAGDIPIAPKYMHIGSVQYPDENNVSILGIISGIFLNAILYRLILVIAILIIRLINRIRYARKRQRQYQNLYRNDRYRYR